MLAPNRPPEQLDDRATWRMSVLVLVFCFLTSMLARGAQEIFSVYLLPISTELGWDHAVVLSINSLTWLLSGAAGPFVGRLFDRAGPRTVYLGGFLLLGLAWISGSLSQHYWQMQLSLGIATGAGFACLGNISASLVLARWFGPRLPTAMAMMFAAGGVGIQLWLPISQLLINHLGWRGAYFACGAAVLGLMIPTALLPWRRLAAGRAGLAPAASLDAITPGPTLREAIRNPAFWGLASTFFFTGTGITAITVQVVAYLVEVGFAPLEAATAWGFTGLMMFIGLSSVGWLDGILGRMPTMLLTYSMTSTGLLVLWLLHRYPSPWLLGAFLVCFGCTLSSRGPLVSASAMQLFRGRHLGTIFGTISIASGLGPAFGSFIGGVIHDLTQAYDWVIVFSLFSIWMGMVPFIAIPALRKI